MTLIAKQGQTHVVGILFYSRAQRFIAAALLKQRASCWPDTGLVSHTSLVLKSILIDCQSIWDRLSRGMKTAKELVRQL